MSYSGWLPVMVRRNSARSQREARVVVDKLRAYGLIATHHVQVSGRGEVVRVEVEAGRYDEAMVLVGRKGSE